jgi:hypothetical protein
MLRCEGCSSFPYPLRIFSTYAYSRQISWMCEEADASGMEWEDSQHPVRDDILVLSAVHST